MLKHALMGCGLVADFGHLPAIVATPGLRLHAVYDPDVGRMLDAKSKFNATYGFTDAREFFRSGFDTLTVSSPAPAHLENVLMAAEYKKHVLCEKPIAATEAEALQMRDAMTAADRKLYVSFVYRFSTVATKIKKLVEEKAIGDVRSLRLIYNWDCHGKFETAADGTRRENRHRAGRMLEGGPMIDCGVHFIDLARWWLGAEVKSHTASGAWIDDYAAPDHVFANLTFGEGRHAKAGAHAAVEMCYSYGHTSRDAPPHYWVELIGTAGVIHYNRNGGVFEIRTADGTRDLGWDFEKNFHGTYATFEKSIRDNADGDMPTAEDGLIATRLAVAVTEGAMARRAQLTGA